jgi:tetratricopeptide (TPR) repeat protein
MKFLIALSLLFPLSALADTCSSRVEAAEAEQDLSKARGLAQKAIAACAKEKVRSARPHMVLCDVAFRAGDFASVVKHAEAGLKEEPGLPLAYMNMCAALSQMKKYDEAIAACEKGLETESGWSAKLNFNLGLAVFQKFVAQEKFARALESEKYFLESAKRDPSIEQNWFYLGTLEENVKNNPQKGVEYFDRACELGHKASCDGKARAEATVQAQKAKGNAPVAVSGDEEPLWKQVEENYRKKGLSAEQAKKLVTDMRANMGALAPEQRLEVVRSMVQSTR